MAGQESLSRAAGPTGCEAHTRFYRGGVLVEQGFEVDRVSDLLADPDGTVWLDLLQPDEADLAVAVEELGLHPLALEDVLHADQRPKLDRYDDHLFLAAYAVRLADGGLAAPGVAAFLTERALVTVRLDPRIALPPLMAHWDAAPNLAASGVAFLAHGLVDLLVDGYVEVARELDERADALEESLFDGVGQDELQQRTFALRSSVSRLHRLVLPVRDVVATMRRPEVGLVDDRMAPYLRDVDDHVERVLHTVEGVRERLATVLDTTLALQGQRLNATLFRLTAYAAILAVTTAITGFFGQNIPYPGLGERSGFVASTVLLVVTVGGLVVWFRRKGWL